jgi:hypothetical protein
MNNNLTAGTPAPFTQVAETTNNRSQRALELAKNWSEDVKRLVEAGRLVEMRELLEEVSQTLGPSDKLAYWQRLFAKPKKLPSTPASSVGNHANVAWIRRQSRPYYGQWVALREGVLLGANDNPDTLQQQLQETGTYSGAVFIKIGG